MVKRVGALVLLAVAAVVSAGLCAGFARADDAAEESAYYAGASYAIPAEVALEVGALEAMPDGRLAVATRRGEVYMVSQPDAADPRRDAKFQLYASGLHEVLGLAYRDGWLYLVQRSEATRTKDIDGDGRADVFETLADGWEISGDYHEYAFGSKFDRYGDLWIALCLTGSFSSDVKFRGWCLRLTSKGALAPTVSGLRSPGGIGMNAAGDMFYTENQGPWNGACALKQLEPGAFVGHPAGLRWYDQAPALGKKPEEPKSDTRLIAEAKRIPELRPPAVYFPYPKMGQSASGIVCDRSGGGFGPFADQLFVADQSASTIMRVVLEKVHGRYQGACIPFRRGFASGNLALLQSPRTGSLYVGGTNRGWGSSGNREFALERLDWTGKTPFEIDEIHARSDGFILSFTAPVDPKTAADPASYQMSTYTYIYQANYGSPEVDRTEPKIVSVRVSDDRLKVRLIIDKPVEGHVHEMRAAGVRSAAGGMLLHPDAFYTMNVIPEADPRPW